MLREIDTRFGSEVGYEGAPLFSGAPAPSSFFDAADALVITRRVRGLVAVW